MEGEGMGWGGRGYNNTLISLPAPVIRKDKKAVTSSNSPRPAAISILNATVIRIQLHSIE